MTQLKILGAAALLASAFASPAMAQAVIEDPAYCSNFYPNANCQNYGRGNPYTGRYQQRVYRHDRAWRDVLVAGRRDGDELGALVVGARDEDVGSEGPGLVVGRVLHRKAAGVQG